MALVAQRGGNGTDLCEHSRGEDDSPSTSLGDGGRAEHDVETITWPNIIDTSITVVSRAEKSIRILTNRKRLARKSSLISLQINTLQYASISRYHISSLQLDDIARYDSRGVNGDAGALSEDSRAW